MQDPVFPNGGWTANLNNTDTWSAQVKFSLPNLVADSSKRNVMSPYLIK